MCDRTGLPGSYAQSCTTTTTSVASFDATIRVEEVGSLAGVFPVPKCFQKSGLDAGRDLESRFGANGLYREAHLIEVGYTPRTG